MNCMVKSLKDKKEGSIVECANCGEKYDLNKEYILLEIDYPHAYCGTCSTEMITDYMEEGIMDVKRINTTK